jgi:AraC-like DNA-binding protein
VRCDQAFFNEVLAAVRASVSAGSSTRIEDVAARLYISRSTLQRRLAERKTSFTELRREARVEVALKRLSAGSSCANAAVYVGLTGDHLCRLITDHVGLRPRQIARANQLSARADRWRRSIPLRSDSRQYIEQMRRWKALEDELAVILAPIPRSGHPLSAWARRISQMARRPDYRKGHYRARVRAARQRERAALAAERRRVDAWWAELQRTQLGIDHRDVVSLENLDIYIARFVNPVSHLRASRGSRDQVGTA